MNERTATAYFDNDSDAQRASEELHDRGIHAEKRSNASHGESFWDSIKNFFSGRDGRQDDTDYRDRYGSGSALVIEAPGNSTMVLEIITRYNGTMEPDPDSATISDYPASPHTTDYQSSTGEVDYAGAMRGDMQRAGSVASTDARKRDLAQSDLTRDDTTI